MNVSDVKFFLKQLQKGKADDIRYRKTIINVFVNAIYLYDDKITFIFNSGDTPITVDDKLLSDIEADNLEFECSFLEQSAPPSKNRRKPVFLYREMRGVEPERARRKRKRMVCVYSVDVKNELESMKSIRKAYMIRQGYFSLII